MDTPETIGGPQTPQQGVSPIWRGLATLGLAVVLMLAPAVALVGCWRNASFAAVPAVMLNALLVAPARPTLAAVSV